jgi:hypothetical protein
MTSQERDLNALFLARKLTEQTIALLKKPGAWTKGANARTSEGTVCFPHQDIACQFCLQGALHRSAIIQRYKLASGEGWVDGKDSSERFHEIFTTVSVAEVLLRTAFQEVMEQRGNHPDSSYPYFNDTLAQSVDEVLELLSAMRDILTTQLQERGYEPVLSSPLHKGETDATS